MSQATCHSSALSTSLVESLSVGTNACSSTCAPTHVLKQVCIIVHQACSSGANIAHFVSTYMHVSCDTRRGSSSLSTAFNSSNSLVLALSAHQYAKERHLTVQACWRSSSSSSQWLQRRFDRSKSPGAHIQWRTKGQLQNHMQGGFTVCVQACKSNLRALMACTDICSTCLHFLPAMELISPGSSCLASLALLRMSVCGWNTSLACRRCSCSALKRHLTGGLTRCSGRSVLRFGTIGSWTLDGCRSWCAIL